MTIKLPSPRRLVPSSFAAYSILYKEYKYEKMIAESQARLAETTLAPGYTKIYC